MSFWLFGFSPKFNPNEIQVLHLRYTVGKLGPRRLGPQDWPPGSVSKQGE